MRSCTHEQVLIYLPYQNFECSAQWNTKPRERDDAMISWRVCSQLEASLQIVGQPWRRPPPNPRGLRSLDEGLHATASPELWRRRLNSGDGPDEDPPYRYGLYWDHTLLLSIPADSLEIALRQCGIRLPEYRVFDPSLARVLGVCGLGWPPPDWCPQPESESEWNPRGRDWKNPSLRDWRPVAPGWELDRMEEE
jgi:hypothetical protein